MPEAKKLTKGVAASTPAPEPETPAVSDNLVNDPAIAPLLQPPQSDTLTSTTSVIQSAIALQDQQLTDLEAEMERRSDEFADRAAAIVRKGLESAYTKAHAKIITIDLPFFGSPQPSMSPASLPLPEATHEAEAIEC